MPHHVQKHLTSPLTKFRFLVKVSEHDFRRAHCICQFCVALSMDRVQQCLWPCSRGVILRRRFSPFHECFKKMPCIFLRDCLSKIHPPLWVTICISNRLSKKTEQLQYSTQEHNSSFYNTTHNIKTIRQILHNIKIDLVLFQTLHYYILKIHIVCDLNMNCLADITICTICRQHAKK